MAASRMPVRFRCSMGFQGNPPVGYYKAGDTADASAGPRRRRPDAQILGPPIDPNPDRPDVEEERAISRLRRRPGILVRSRLSAARSASSRSATQPGDRPAHAPQAEIQGPVGAARSCWRPKPGKPTTPINNQSLVTLFTFKGKTAPVRRRRAMGQLGEFPLRRKGARPDHA